MRGTTGILLIALGLIMMYVILSDKYACFVQFYDCLLGNDYKTGEGFTKQVTTNLSSFSGSGFDVFGLLKRGDNTV